MNKLAEKKITDFLKTLLDLYKNTKMETYLDEIERLNRYYSPYFNYIKTINLKEENISSILKELLDSNGTHGQGCLFLKEFIKQLIKSKRNLEEKLTNLKYENIKISTEEVYNNNRRKDISIKFHRFEIAIENKPWAKDQKLQILDYINSLEVSSLEEEINDYLVIYLSGTGQEPSESSITKEKLEKFLAENKLVILTYNEFLIPWIKSCIKGCKSKKVSLFLEDFLSYLQETFAKFHEKF